MRRTSSLLAAVAVLALALAPGLAEARAGYGSSFDSSEATPVCSTIGVTPTPLATSRAMMSAVKGRPALGISLLPGSVA